MDMNDEQNQTKYVVHHAVQSAIGDYANVNVYFPAPQAAADPGLAELRRLFEEVNRQLAALEEADRDLVTPAVEQAAQAAAEIQTGDESEAKQSFLETRLKAIYAMRKEIGEVIIATLANPAAGIALVIQKIAQKAQAELGTEREAGTT
jgi:hypothetical protein